MSKPRIGGKRPILIDCGRRFFSLFTFLFPLLLKNIWSVKNLQNYNGGRDLPLCPTAVGGAWYCSAFLPPAPRR
jgi:hypothetical protein